MKTKAEKQLGALQRFSVRKRKEDESEQDYKSYCARKSYERDVLIKAVGTAPNEGTINE